jgi:hypothetical protein
VAVASPVDTAVNPNNRAQRYVLWGNGRIDAVGGAVPVTGQDTWYQRIDQPIAVALHILDWATGAGYMLDLYGGFHPLNGATLVALGGLGEVQGVPYTNPTRRYVDWSWNPDGSGQGYVLDHYGQLHAFGGATAPPRTGRMWTWPAARKLVMDWGATRRGIIMDLYGGLHDEFATLTLTGYAYWPGQDYARDVVVTAWSASPDGYTLDLWGGVHKFGTAPGPIGALVPYRRGADVARKLEVVDPADPLRFWVVWSGGQQFEFVSSTPPSVNAGGGTSEVQTVTITGSPTGGSFTLTYSGQTTAAISWDATAATVDAALEALSNVGAGDVSVTGGPGPGTPWTVTFTGALAVTDVPQMTAASSLTGGTSPAVAVSTTTPGVTASPPLSVTGTTRPVLSWTFSDPQADSQAAWELYVYTQVFADARNMSDPSVWAADALVAESGINPTTRGVASPVDLGNGGYRLFVRARDTSDLWSPWDSHDWAQNVPLPTAPTGLSATADEATFSVALSVTATTGEAADLIRFEASDDAGVTWLPVRGAQAVTLAATTTATDWDPPLGVTRTYRAVAYAVDPAVASPPSVTASVVISRDAYALTAVDDPTLGGEISAQAPVTWSRPLVRGVFQGVGADYPTIIKDGSRPRARKTTLNVLCESQAEWDVIEALVESTSTLVYRDPFGRVMYCELQGSWDAEQLLAAAGPNESTAMRHMHATPLPLVEVRPPHLAT